MLNYTLLQDLYSRLPESRKKILLKQLFGESKQSMAYFKRVKDTSMSKLEILADFFNVPLDALRQDSQYAYETTTKRIGRKSDSERIKSLEDENAKLKERIGNLEEVLSIKEERVELLQEKVEFYKVKQ